MDSYHGPINADPKIGESSISIYLYQPWMSAAVAGVAAFGLALVVQGYYLWSRKGTRWFHGMLALGSLIEVGGYAARMRGNQNMFLVDIFVAQYLMIVIAPIPIAAAIYLVLTYAANRFPCGSRLLLIPPKRLVTFFVLMDIITVLVQVCGAAFIGVVGVQLSRNEPLLMSLEAASGILLAGLGVQTISFLGFLILLVVALWRTSTLDLNARSLRNLRVLLYLNLLSALFISFRTVYRLAVECQGYFGQANSSQVLFTCLEFLPVILAVAVFCAVPIGQLFPFIDDLGAHSNALRKETSYDSSNWDQPVSGRPVRMVPRAGHV